MTEQKLNQFIYLALVFVAMGLLFIFFSFEFGSSFADGIFSSAGYSIEIYEARISAYVNSFLATGGILFATGVTGVLFAYYKKLSLKNE